MSRKFFFIAGLVFLLIGIADNVLWIIISAPEAISFDASVKEYISLYPKFLASPIKLTFLNIILFLIAIGCFILSANKSNRAYFRRTCYVLIVLSGILAFWNLFSLM